MRGLRYLYVVLVVCAFVASSTSAATPNLVSFQGRLTNSGGSPLTGTYSVQFALYNVSTGGSPFWQETQSVTTDANGMFVVALGSVTPLGSFAISDPSRYLGVKVGSDAEMVPRTRVLSAPFARTVETLHNAVGGTVFGELYLGPGRVSISNTAIGSPGLSATTYVSSAQSNYGVYGGANSSSSANYGVFGLAYDANGSSNSAGIYGVGISLSGGSIWAGYFDGWTKVNGNFYASAKFFQIDDPLDPANSTLEHACVESNEHKNVYDGIVTLDASGAATVIMPGWFEALNQEFRYQLTCIGGFAPVYIATEVSGDRFSVAGGKAGMKVSWQVTGVRKDPYALAHPVRVEKVKPEAMRGKYLNPREYGVDEKLGVDYAARQHGLEMRQQSEERAKAAAVEGDR